VIIHFIENYDTNSELTSQVDELVLLLQQMNYHTIIVSVFIRDILFDIMTMVM